MAQRKRTYQTLVQTQCLLVGYIDTAGLALFTELANNNKYIASLIIKLLYYLSNSSQQAVVCCDYITAKGRCSA